MNVRRTLGFLFLIIAVATIALWAVSTFVQPGLPPSRSSALYLLGIAFAAVLAAAAALNEITDLGERVSRWLRPKGAANGQEIEFDAAFLRRQRCTMLDVVERQWIQGRLERSLHYQAPIFLGMEEVPEAVERPWEYEIQTPEAALRRSRNSADILNLLDECGSLLILGAPGSGKTITLLDLARQLIERARRNEEAPPPVIFVLASWALQRKPLAEWMLAELDRQYQVPLALGLHWIQQHAFLPLLDGLDEVEESARAACVEAINAFRRGAVGGAAVVVCSREAEYIRLETCLQVEAAIALKPLSEPQIKHFVTRLGQHGELLARMLAENEELRGLARTPLWLDVMAVAYAGTVTTSSPPTTLAAILNAYIRRVLLQHRRPLHEWSPGQCLRWLRWLAQQLERTEQQMFRLEEMQPDWLGDPLEQRAYRRRLRWVAALISITTGVPIALIGNMQLGGRLNEIALAIFIIMAGLIWSSFADRYEEAEGRFIAPTTGLEWNWGSAVSAIPLGLNLGLYGGIAVFVLAVFGLSLGRYGALWVSLAVALPMSLLGVLLFGLIRGLQPARGIGRDTRPNQGMTQSARNGVVFGLIVAVMVALVVCLFSSLLVGWQAGVPFGIFVGIYVGLMRGIGSVRAGGEAAFRHAILRWRFWRSGLTPEPWRYVAFLEAMTDHLLLDRIGGAYQFRHDLMQKHIAQLDDDSIAALDRASPTTRAVENPPQSEAHALTEP